MTTDGSSTDSAARWNDPLAPRNAVADRDKFGHNSWPAQFWGIVQGALWSAGVDPYSLSDWDISHLADVLWEKNAYMRNVYGDRKKLAGEGAGSNQNIFLAKEVHNLLFDPSKSPNAAALQIGMRLLRQANVPLTGPQEARQQAADSQVPLPFDPQYFGNVTQGYGEDGHTGIDYAMPENTPLYSPFAGRIEIQDGGSGYGKRVLVRLTNGYTFALAHMSAFNVTQNQQINPGDLLGFSGSTGRSTGPHVHLEWMDPKGNYTNPSEIMAPIFGGTTFGQIGQTAAFGQGPDVVTQLSGLDPGLRQKFSPVVQMWQQYFGRQPTTSELIGLVGTSALKPATPQVQAAGATAAPGGRQDIRDLARQAGFPESQLDIAVAIALAESRGDPNAVGKEFGEKGLMQIYGGVHPDLEKKYNLFDPLQNMQAAYDLWKAAGGSWRDWSTYTTNDPATGKPWYLAYLGKDATIQSTAGQPDMAQISDTIRGMPSHIPGMNMGQYSDMRAAADKVSGEVLGHGATDGVVADLYKQGYTTQSQMKFWYNTQSDAVLAKMDMQTYNQIYKANQPWLAGVYNQRNLFDPRIATTQHVYPDGGQPGMPNPATGPQPEPYNTGPETP